MPCSRRVAGLDGNQRALVRSAPRASSSSVRSSGDVRDALSHPRDGLGHAAHQLHLVAVEEERTKERAVHAVAEKCSRAASRSRVNCSANCGVSSTSGLSSPCQQSMASVTVDRVILPRPSVVEWPERSSALRLSCVRHSSFVCRPGRLHHAGAQRRCRSSVPSAATDWSRRRTRAVDDELRHACRGRHRSSAGDAVALEVGRRVQEVDRVGHAVLDRELDRVHLVAERLVDRLRVADDAVAELRRQIRVVDDVAPLARIVVRPA